MKAYPSIKMVLDMLMLGFRGGFEVSSCGFGLQVWVRLVLGFKVSVRAAFKPQMYHHRAALKTQAFPRRS